MARSQARYACQQCGAVHAKWTGRCEGCGAWNSLIEETAARGAAAEPAPRTAAAGGALGFVGLTGPSMLPPRRQTGIAELDRVCGGGFVPGSAILVGGDPGIGKSTLLLQAAAAVAAAGRARAYITGEEAIDQVRLRAERLGVAGSPVLLAAASNVRDIVASLDRDDAPDLVVVDSIQTMYLDTMDSAPGTVSQVRGAAQELIRVAKRRGFVLVLVGHVTKEGADRRPARARAHGRHRALFRRRARPPVPHLARGQEPLWRDRRDRRVRDERPRPRRGAEPVGAVSCRAAAPTHARRRAAVRAGT